MSAFRGIAARALLNTGTTARCANRLTGIEEIDFSDLGAKREPRDEAALLLSVGAEIEHALMVQYLYSAYSIRQDQANHELRGEVAGVADRLVQIAREEMGHFITVQNLLHSIGAPLHFERQDSPFESVLHPFRFKLEKCSRGALAKYVTAESPVVRPPDMTDEEWERLCRIALEAKAANDGQTVRHVGQLYARLIDLFTDPVDGVSDADFVTGPDDRQAQDADWGFDPGTSIPGEEGSRRVQVDSFTHEQPARQRQAAVTALRVLSEQGEGFGAGIESHFERFLDLYGQFESLTSRRVEFVWPVATNPSVIATSEPADWSSCDVAGAVRAAFAARGTISDPRSRDWAILFNIRYRLLLAFLAHFLRTSGGRYVETEGPAIGDPTERGLLLIWTFDEMRRVKKIAQKLVHLPLCDPDDGRRAGAPFQLPYSLSVADQERHRWRGHLDAVRSAIGLIQAMQGRAGAIDRDDPFLHDLRADDARRERVLAALASGQPIPEGTLPSDFSKVVHILEQAVRGFSINVHGNFWSGRTRDQFVGQHIFNNPLFGRESADGCRLSAARSYLLRVIAGRMPAYRPTIHASRQRFIADWVEAQAPDSVPSGQAGVHTEARPLPEPAPPPFRVEAVAAAAPSYATDIRPLFRDFDRAFVKRLAQVDLDDEEDVKQHADWLAAGLKAGTLPYDANWPAEQVELFLRWAEGLKDD